MGRRLHFVGVGGCGMSGLARMAAARGARCTGSDRKPSPLTDQLQTAGIDVEFDQTAEALPDALDELVISAAVKPDHPQVLEAQRRGVPVTKYARMLGRLMAQQTGVAIAGTHGKSTTTSLLAHILLSAGLDPSFIVGANCAQIGGGWRVGAPTPGSSPVKPAAGAACGAVPPGSSFGNSPVSPPRDSQPIGETFRGGILLAEACEYDRSFHQLRPTHAVILNVEADHLDLYSSLDEIVEAFNVFARRLPVEGSLLVNHEMGPRLAVTTGVRCPVQTIGFAPQAEWRVRVDEDEQGGRSARVTLAHHGKPVAAWTSPMPGEHMGYNAAVAAVTAHRLGAPWDRIARAIESFRGLDRRMQVVGEYRGQGAKGPRGQGWGVVDDSASDARGVDDDGSNNDSKHSAPRPLGPSATSAPALIIDDYGHHPTEVDTTLRALRQHYKPRRLICVFQPHQHSRTRFLMAQFATSFAAADRVIVPDIYFVRDSEQERQAVTAADLVAAIEASGSSAQHIAELDAIVDHVRGMLQPGDLLVTMGAGDVWKVSHALVNG